MESPQELLSSTLGMQALKLLKQPGQELSSQTCESRLDSEIHGFNQSLPSLSWWQSVYSHLQIMWRWDGRMRVLFSEGLCYKTEESRTKSKSSVETSGERQEDRTEKDSFRQDHNNKQNQNRHPII